MRLKEISAFFEKYAPLMYQESYDNSGMQVGDYSMELRGAIVTLDVTEAVIDEAISKGANLVIAHHPVIFTGIKSLTGKNLSERVIVKAIKNDVAIYAAHTNMDAVENGVNGKICEKLELQKCRILEPMAESGNAIYPLENISKNVGMGMVGELKSEMTEKDFMLLLKEKFDAPCIRHTAFLGKKIRKVAVSGGAGSFLLSRAISSGADVFVSGDFKYHQFFDADGRIIIADIGHFESEQYTRELFYELLTKNFPKFAVHLSEVNTNPVFYF